MDQKLEPEDTSAYVQDTAISNTATENLSERPVSNSTSVYAMSEMGPEEETTSISNTTLPNPSETDVPKTIKIVFKPASEVSQEPNDTVGSRTEEPKNGNDMLDMVLPETLTLVQLLDLAGEHLDLDYVYNPGTIGNPTVTLKLHGSLQGQMRVKDMYSLLETVLKFNNLAMIRRDNNMVTIVPSDKVLEADPQLVGDNGEKLAVGDTVVTRVFALKYVNASSVSKLLENMKLGVAVTPMEDIQMLFVTCYAVCFSNLNPTLELLKLTDFKSNSTVTSFTISTYKSLLSPQARNPRCLNETFILSHPATTENGKYLACEYKICMVRNFLF